MRLQAEEARLKILTRRRKLERSESKRDVGSRGGARVQLGPNAYLRWLYVITTQTL